MENPKKSFEQLILGREFPGCNLDFLTDDNKEKAMGRFLENFRSGGIVKERQGPNYTFKKMRRFLKNILIIGPDEEEKWVPQYTFNAIAEKILNLGYVENLEEAKNYVPEIVKLTGKSGIFYSKFFKSSPINNQPTYHLGDYEHCLC